MGMCKACKEVFNTNDMVDGYCKNCSTEEIIKNTEANHKKYINEKTIRENLSSSNRRDKIIGFIIGFSLAILGEIALITLIGLFTENEIAPRGAGWIIIPIMAGIAGINQWKKIKNIKFNSSANNLLTANDFMIAAFSSLFIGWLLFLKGTDDSYDDNLVDPVYSVGFKLFDELFDINYSDEISISYLLYVIFLFIIYKISVSSLVWLKYKRLAFQMERHFISIYNFHLPEQNKTKEIILAIAMCSIFEEARQTKLTRENLICLLEQFDNASRLKQYFQRYIDTNNLQSLYSTYNNYRAMNYMPLVSTLLTFEHLVEVPDKSKIEEFVSEYNRNPLVSFEAKI